MINGVGSVQDPFHCGLCGWLRLEVMRYANFDQWLISNPKVIK